MAKSQVLHFRVTDVLKAKYETALAENGVSITDHLTGEIAKYISVHERKKKMIARLVRKQVREQMEKTAQD